jgi:hypothetical protein
MELMNREMRIQRFETQVRLLVNLEYPALMGLT